MHFCRYIALRLSAFAKKFKGSSPVLPDPS